MLIVIFISKKNNRKLWKKDKLLRELYFNLHCSKLKIIYDQDEGNLGYDFHSRKSRKT